MIEPTKPRPGLEGAGGFDPVAMWQGPNYKFFYNDGTGSGDLHVMKLEIPLSNAEAKRFAEADEAARQTMLKPMIEAHEARKAARKAGAR